MKAAVKQAATNVLFDKFQLRLTQGNNTTYLQESMKELTAPETRKVSRFATSWKARAHKTLFGATRVEWLGG